MVRVCCLRRRSVKVYRLRRRSVKVYRPRRRSLEVFRGAKDLVALDRPAYVLRLARLMS